TGTGQMEVIEYSNHEGGHGTNPSFGIEHKAELVISAGDIVLAEEGDYIKVNNTSDVEQLSYLRIFDSEGARS
ncbi:cupin, partial [Gammaproteobacteria bacterium]|nr:cupin [Gammaproteobacteria bacterium]